MKKQNILIKISFTGLLLSSTIFFSTFALSEVTLDGSTGTTGSLAGPDYQITEDLGRRAGSNLFHSFGQFNINSAESATFSGSTGIKNVISRVTGGQTSTIDGAFRSTIPGANVYFLNPAGVIFGENASLDVQGSFHASTADYLKFKDGVKFKTGLADANPILTTSSPESFGFLDNAPASIVVSGGRSNNVLKVPEDETLSLIGGDISINDSSLDAAGGRVILASAGSAGEFIVNEAGVDSSSFTKGGNIHINHSANSPMATIENNIPTADIDVSADSAGKVVIRGGQMVMDNASIWAATTNGAGGMIDIKLADNLTLNGATEKSEIEKNPQMGITTGSLGKGNAGNILLDINELKLTNKAQIQSITNSSGHGGDITINANSILLKGNNSKTHPKLMTSATETGNAGNIRVNATEQVKISNAEISSTTTFKGQDGGHAGAIIVKSPSIEVTGINSNISTETGIFATGNAGDITIQTENLEMLDGTKINAKTSGRGLGGDITVNSSTILLSGLNTGFVAGASENRANNAGNIVVNSDSLDMCASASIDTTTFHGADKNSNSTQNTSSIVGKGGDISLNVNNINMRESRIKADNFGSANAGNIEIKTNTLTLSNNSAITSGTFSTGQAGDIEIKADNISLNDAAIQSHSFSILDIENNSTTAMSGDIKIDINNTLRLENQSAIAVSTEKANAGSIEINNGKQLLLSTSKITTSAADSTGSGGHITIDTPIVALDASRIIAQAKKGNGGDISISGFLFKSPSSVVDASSKFSENGHLDLKPETDISGSITMLSGSMLNVQEHMSDICSSRKREIKNSFVIKNRGGIPLSPGSLVGSTYMDFSTTTRNDLPSEENNKTVTYLAKQLLNNAPCGE